MEVAAVRNGDSAMPLGHPRQDRACLLECRQSRRVVDRRVVDRVLGDDVEHRVIEPELAKARPEPELGEEATERARVPLANPNTR